MGAKEKALSLIAEIKELILDENPLDSHLVDTFETIEEEIDTDIPGEVRNLIASSEITDENVIFLAFRAIDYEGLRSQYVDKSEGSTFFGAYRVDENFEVSEEYEIGLYESLEEELDEDVEIKNVRKFVPLFVHGADYLVLDLRPESLGNILVISDAYTANILAPSLLEHLEDLAGGIKDDSYKVIDDFEIQYPTSWHNRKKVRSGLYYLDEDGDVVEK